MKKVKKVKKVLGIPKQLIDELEEVRKNFKRKDVMNNGEYNQHLREVSAIINELTHIKRILLTDRKKSKYMLNFDFPVRKKENE